MEELNTIKYLYLTQINGINENELELILEEAVNSKKINEFAIENEDIQELKEILKNSFMIKTMPGCRKFKITWKKYLGYNIINESNAIKDESIKYKPTDDNIIIDSKYLRFLKDSTDYYTFDENEMMQWNIYCLNHLI